MRDSLDFDTVPLNEECTPAGRNPEQERRECKALINQLRRMFGDEPAGARLRIASNPHDFGSYLSVQCRFDDEIEAAAEYAYRIENDFPHEWDSSALVELSQSETAAVHRRLLCLSGHEDDRGAKARVRQHHHNGQSLTTPPAPRRQRPHDQGSTRRG